MIRKTYKVCILVKIKMMYFFFCRAMSMKNYVHTLEAQKWSKNILIEFSNTGMTYFREKPQKRENEGGNYIFCFPSNSTKDKTQKNKVKSQWFGYPGPSQPIFQYFWFFRHFRNIHFENNKNNDNQWNFEFLYFVV